MGLLDRLLGRRVGQPGQPADRGLPVSARCAACGEVIRARINPTAELSLQDDGTYFVRKVLVGQQCFRPVEVQLRYADAGGRALLASEAHGGTLVGDAPPPPAA